MKTTVELRTELQTLMNEAKKLDAELRGKPESTAEDAEKYNRMIDAGMAKRAEYEASEKAEKFLAGDAHLNQAAGTQKAQETMTGRRKTAGQIVVESQAFKNATKDKGMERVLVGGLKSIYNVTATITEPILSPAQDSDLANLINLARQRPPSVIDLVHHQPTSSTAVEYILMTGRNGSVTGVTITAQGSGYVVGTAVATFSAAPAGGRTATGTPIVVAGAITGVTITDGGAGYVTAPTVAFSVTGTGATGTPLIGGAAVVPEYSGGIYGLKPSGDLAFSLAIALVKTIAEWIPVSKQILDDAPRLQDIIDNELSYQVKLLLEDQIIGGDGSGNNFTGILNTTGIQTRVMSASAPSGRGQGNTTATANTIIDTIRRGITDLRLAFYQPDGIVVNPSDGESMELLKSTLATYVMVYDPIAMRVWRVPVVETAAMTALTGIVGNFQLGATLWDRQESEILVGQPNDFFLRNAFAVLAELRAAFAVTRPLAFEKMTFIANV